MQGEKISHYRILEEIGRGGMGIVYKARDDRLGRFVAIKFLTDEWEREEDALKRFRQEARAASSLNHPNICTVYDIDEYEGRLGDSNGESSRGSRRQNNRVRNVNRHRLR